MRRKTQVRGRSNRAIAARRKVSSAHEDELKRDWEDPESNGLDLITESVIVVDGGCAITMT